MTIPGTVRKPLGRRAGIKRGRARLRRKSRGLREWWQAPPAGTRARLKWDLDRFASKLVRRRDKACVTCGRTKGLQASHFYSRRYYSVRWNLTNLAAMCGPCNLRHNTNPWPYTNWFLNRHGDEELSKLFALRNDPRKIPDAELEELLEEFKLMLKRMKGQSAWER